MALDAQQRLDMIRAQIVADSANGCVSNAATLSAVIGLIDEPMRDADPPERVWIAFEPRLGTQYMVAAAPMSGPRGTGHEYRLSALDSAPATTEEVERVARAIAEETNRQVTRFPADWTEDHRALARVAIEALRRRT